METTVDLGPLSLVPASVAILLAFLTRNTVFSLAVACLAGVLVAGDNLLGFPAFWSVRWAMKISPGSFCWNCSSGFSLPSFSEPAPSSIFPVSSNDVA